MKLTKENEKRFVNNYLKSQITDIMQAYKKPSIYKINAFNSIKEEMETYGGEDLKITSRNANYFSVAYKLNNKLIYHTYLNRYEIQLWIL